MLDDLDWAEADLDRATALMKQAIASDSVVNETWLSGDVRWRIRSWQNTVEVGRGEAVPTLKDVVLSAQGPTFSRTFSWNGEGWNTA